MFLFSEEGVLSKGLSVEFHVVLDGLNAGFNLGFSGLEEVEDDIFHTGDIGFSILDILFVLDNEGVVLIGSGLEVIF